MKLYAASRLVVNRCTRALLRPRVKVGGLSAGGHAAAVAAVARGRPRGVRAANGPRPDARAAVAREGPGLSFALHAASEFNADVDALARCIDDIGKADIIFVCMLFIEDHIQSVLPALQARREDCDAMVVCLSAPEITKLTRIGKLFGERDAKACGVSDKTVTAHREHLRNSEDSDSDSGPGKRLVERGGTTYEQDTSNIGKGQPKGPGTPPKAPPSTAKPAPAKTQAQIEADELAGVVEGGGVNWRSVCTVTSTHAARSCCR